MAPSHRRTTPLKQDERPLPPLTGTARAKELNRALRRLVCGGAGQINELDRRRSEGLWKLKVIGGRSKKPKRNWNGLQPTGDGLHLVAYIF